MKALRSALLAVAAAAVVTAPAFAEPEYTTIKLEIDIAKPAKEVWAKVGGYCDISKWLNNVDCVITSGDGGVGTVRVLAGGRVTEILVAQTELSYGYTQPAREGQFYNLYHGFMEARPVTDHHVEDALHAGLRRLRQSGSGGEGCRHRAAARHVRRRAQEHEGARRGQLTAACELARRFEGRTGDAPKAPRCGVAGRSGSLYRRARCQRRHG